MPRVLADARLGRIRNAFRREAQLDDTSNVILVDVKSGSGP
jgi:hypothetical protein